ncbi:MAG: DUF4126 domain-containing protein [Jatrophihabitantaceae bacterium]
MSILIRSMLLGLATGGRSSIGLAALAATADRSTGSVLTGRWAARLAGLAATGELIGDKLPQTPSRLQPAGAVARLALGAVGAGVLAHRDGNRRAVTLLASALGLAGAAAGTQLGARWRAIASVKFGADLPAALIEDAGCLAAAAAATRR